MATSHYRTVKKALGKAGSFLAPSSGATKGLRELLAAMAADLNDLQAHTHRYDGSDAGLAQSTGPQSDAAGAHTGGTDLTFTPFVIE